jgi:hypothetical protein
MKLVFCFLTFVYGLSAQDSLVYKSLGQVLLDFSLKKTVLNTVGEINYSKIVGNNPDLFVKNGTIWLKGIHKNYSNKLYNTNLNPNNLFK